MSSLSSSALDRRLRRLAVDLAEAGDQAAALAVRGVHSPKRRKAAVGAVDLLRRRLDGIAADLDVIKRTVEALEVREARNGRTSFADTVEALPVRRHLLRALRGRIFAGLDVEAMADLALSRLDAPSSREDRARRVARETLEAFPDLGSRRRLQAVDALTAALDEALRLAPPAMPSPAAGLDAARRAAAEAAWQAAEIGADELVAVSGWESATNDDDLRRRVFLAGKSPGDDTRAAWLVVRFAPGAAEIRDVTLDGESLPDAQPASRGPWTLDDFAPRPDLGQAP